jgi:hypothetical protein
LVIESKVCPRSHAFVGGMGDFASAARLIFCAQWDRPSG